MKFYILLIILSTSLISYSQKSTDLEIKVDSTIKIEKIEFEFWNGNVQTTLKDSFINNSSRLRVQYFSKYAPIMISYKLKDGKKINNTFFVGEKKSKLFISEKNPNTNGEIKFTYSSDVLCVTDSIKNPLFRDLMKCRKRPSELITELYIKNGGNIEKSDSLKDLRNHYFKELNYQTMNYLKDKSSEYFSFWYFWYQVVTPSTGLFLKDTVYLKSLIHYFHTTFPKKFQQSYEGNYMMQRLEGVINPPNIYSNVPNFSKTDLFGEKISIDKFKGKYVLLDFWASWCVPCLASVPVLKDLSKKYAADSFVIIGISIDEDKLKMKSSIKDKEMKWYHIWDYDNELSNVFAVFKIPTFLLIDKEGKIVFRGLGLDDKEKVAKYLNDKLGNGN